MGWRTALLILVGVTMSARAAGPEWMTEREANAKGEQALREQRWDDAIAAFAQSDKSYPAPTWHDAWRDGRAVRIGRAIPAILQELDEKGAPAADMLPYWDFYVRGFPFFSSMVDPELPELQGVFDRCFLAAAEEHRRQLDPHGTDERFALCRKVASASADEVIDLLENGWPEHHDDFGLCACRACKALYDDLKIDCARKSKAYLSRFASSACLGIAAARLGHGGEDLRIATDPIAIRSCLLEESRSAPADFKDPWLPASLLKVWTVVDIKLGASTDDEVAEANGRLHRIAHEMPKSPDLGLIFIAIASSSFRGEWSYAEDRYARFLAEWKEISPDDPYRPWGVLWPFLGGSPLPVRDEDRKALREVAARYPTEAIRPFVECVLAKDALFHGHGEEAQAYYEAALTFDPGGVRLPCPFRAEAAMAEARGRLIDFWSFRDPKRLGPLARMELDTEGGLRETVDCVSTNQGLEVQHVRELARPFIRAGALDEAMTVYEKHMTSDWSDGDERLVVDYVMLCLRTGQPARMGDMAWRLETLAPAVAASLGHAPPHYAAFAARLHACEKDLGFVHEKGMDAAVSRLEEILSHPDPNRNPGDPIGYPSGGRRALGPGAHRSGEGRRRDVRQTAHAARGPGRGGPRGGGGLRPLTRLPV